MKSHTRHQSDETEFLRFRQRLFTNSLRRTFPQKFKFCFIVKVVSETFNVF